MKTHRRTVEEWRLIVDRQKEQDQTDSEYARSQGVGVASLRAWRAKFRSQEAAPGTPIVEVKKGYARLSLRIEEKHLNGIGMVQGGAIFTLADYAFGVASNADGSTTVGINAAISYFKTPTGAVIFAEACEESVDKKICGYKVMITDEDGSLVASFSGLGYRKSSRTAVGS